MAEGWARHFNPKGYIFYSAGVAASHVHPSSVRVMQEIGIDISKHYSKSLAKIPMAEITSLITLCGNAQENCPTFPGPVKHTHWPIEDPFAAGGSDENILNAFRKVRDDIRDRLESYFNEPKS